MDVTDRQIIILCLALFIIFLFYIYIAQRNTHHTHHNTSSSIEDNSSRIVSTEFYGRNCSDSNCSRVEATPSLPYITGYAFSTTQGSELYPWYLNNLSATCSPNDKYKYLGELPMANPPLNHYERN